MLKLTRKPGEAVHVGSGTVIFHKQKGRAIDLLFDFPENIRIMRTELCNGEENNQRTKEERRTVSILRHLRSNIVKLQAYRDVPMHEAPQLVDEALHLVDNLLGASSSDA